MGLSLLLKEQKPIICLFKSLFITRGPWTATPALDKAEVAGKNIYSYIQNMFKTGFLFWENTQSVHAKVVETATKSLFSFATPMETGRTNQAESYITLPTKN